MIHCIITLLCIVCLCQLWTMFHDSTGLFATHTYSLQSVDLQLVEEQSSVSPNISSDEIPSQCTSFLQAEPSICQKALNLCLQRCKALKISIDCTVSTYTVPVDKWVLLAFYVVHWMLHNLIYTHPTPSANVLCGTPHNPYTDYFVVGMHRIII